MIEDKIPWKRQLAYHGAYENLAKSYALIIKWLEENKYEIADNPRESFIDGCWNKKSVDEWLTEIQIPVKKSV